MTIISVLLFYLAVGFLWTGLLEFINSYTKATESLDTTFRLVNTILWPISLVLFIYSFLKSSFTDDNF